MSELLKEVPVEDKSKEVLLEKHTYSDKTINIPCSNEDKACQMRWVIASCDCE